MSLYPFISSNYKGKNEQKPTSVLFAARVKQVLLSDDDKIFEKLGGWGHIGAIQFKPVYGYTDVSIDNNFFAKPMFSNIKQYPLKEEIVLIISAPAASIADDPNSKEYYYIPMPLGVWNSPNHNALPDSNYYEAKREDISLGKTFQEKSEARNLLSEEGDVIIQGRNSQGIRFSSTVTGKNNPWSSAGENGSPITIITNKIADKEDDPWVPTYEDINEDGSSIYLCSTQEIPINFASKNLQTLNVTLSAGFNPSLQIQDTNTF